MNIKKKMEFFTDPLIYNASFLFLTNVVSLPLSILQLKIVTTIFSSHTIGIVTSLTSTMAWIALLSRLGVNTGVRRYFADFNDKKGLINTSYMFISIISLFGGTVSLILLSTTFGTYSIILNNITIFFILIATIIATNINTITEAVLVTSRKTFVLPIKKILISIISIILIFSLANFGVIGYIISLNFAEIFFSVLLVLFLHLFITEYELGLMLDTTKIKKILKFSLSNYYMILLTNYTKLVPIIAVILISPESAAYYSIVMTFVYLINGLSSSFGISLMVEGVYDPNRLKTKIVKTIGTNLALIIPMIIGTIYFGDIFLAFFGDEYRINAYNLLILWSLSIIPTTVFGVYNNICYVLNELKNPLVINSANSIFTLIGFIFLSPYFGLNAFGISLLCVSLIIGVFATIKILIFLYS